MKKQIIFDFKSKFSSTQFIIKLKYNDFKTEPYSIVLLFFIKKLP